MEIKDMRIDWDTNYKCAIVGCWQPAEKPHHIIHGTKGNKKFSEQNNLMIPLCRHHHEMCHHTSAELDYRLKELAQQRYLETHTMEEWMANVGRNYTNEEVDCAWK